MKRKQLYALILLNVLSIRAKAEAGAAPLVLASMADTSVVCDYLVVTPRLFKTGAEQLAAHRNRHPGDRVEYAHVAIAEDIQKEFGNPADTCPVNPKVLWTAFKWAYEHWRTPFRYLVLVGDDSVGLYAGPDGSYRFNRGPMPTFVSSCTIRYNEAGAAVPEIRFTDDWYAALAFDDTLSILSGGLQYARVPLSLGRIPCENSRQCSLYVEKLVRYEVDGMTGNPQANTVRLIAEDNRTAGGYDSFSFGLSAEHVSYMLRYAGFDLVQACVSSMPESPVDSVRTWLFDRMEAGGRYTVFFGHGAPDALTTRGLLRSGDWELFQHESLPTIFLSFSCLNGLYQLPADRSMVKSWLFSPTGGAIAYVAATAVTYTDDNLALASRFMAFDTVRTGEYTDLGTRLYRSRSVSGRDDDYHLFGDPAIPGVRNRVPLFAGFLDETMTIRCAIDDTALSAGTFTARISAERMAEVPGNPSRTYIAVDPVHEIRGTFSAAVWDITVPAWVDTCRPDSKLRCAVYACDAGYEARQTVYLREITAGRNPMPSPLRTPAGMSVRLAGGMAEVRCTGLTRPQQVRLLLLDLAGRCVDAQPLSSDGVARFDIRLRSPGHYMVMMQGDGGPVKRPFCIYGGRR